MGGSLRRRLALLRVPSSTFSEPLNVGAPRALGSPRKSLRNIPAVSAVAHQLLLAEEKQEVRFKAE